MAISRKTLTPGAFTEIALLGYGEVTVTQAAATSLEVEADESIISLVGGELHGNRLRLGLIMPWYEWLTFWWTWIFSPKKLVYRVTAPRIDFLEITGSGVVTAADIRTERCALRVSGSGKILFQGEVAGTLSAIITGSGVIECRGSAGIHDVTVTGSGAVRSSGLRAQRAAIRITGSGGVAVTASEALDVRIAGSGSVRYGGQPKLQTRITGSGSVRQET